MYYLSTIYSSQRVASIIESKSILCTQKTGAFRLMPIFAVYFYLKFKLQH